MRYLIIKNYSYLYVLLIFVLYTQNISFAQNNIKKCKSCKGSGYILCKNHPKDIIEIEGCCIRCSKNIKCKKCKGTLKRVCKTCKIKKEDSLNIEKNENVLWLDKMIKIDEYVKSKNIMHCESKHFILTFNLPKISIGKKTYKTHKAMHVYLQRLESLYLDVCKDLGAEDKDFLSKTHVMIWEREHEVVKSAYKYCRQNSNTKSYLLGKAPIFTIYNNRGHLHEEYELHQAVVHNVVHCLLSNVWNGIWPGNIKGGWIDSGYAHYYELLYFKQYGGAVRNYCYREGEISKRFKYGKWASSVRKMVKNKEERSFVLVCSKNIDQLEPIDHMLSWSYVDFILKEHKDKFGKIALSIKQRKSITETLKNALNITPFQFEEKWKDFVLNTYPLKEKKNQKYK